MAGPKLRIPRPLGLSRLTNRGLGRLAPLTDLKAPKTATPALGAAITAPRSGIAKDGFSHPQSNNPWRIFTPAVAASELLMSSPTAAGGMPRLGIVGGKAGKYPTLQNFIPLPIETDEVSTQDFRDIIEDHFHPDAFKAPDLRIRRDIVMDRLTRQEAVIDSDFARKTGGPFPVSTATQAMVATDAFLARTRARSEAFVELLDLRVADELRDALGADAAFTDMDFEAGRNHVLAAVLSEGIGIHLPIASGKISVSTHEGVIVLRPERLEDYAAIDRSIQDGKISGEALTGGFYRGKSSLGLPFIVINPAMGHYTWSVLRHELQHLRKYASNRFEPFWQMPAPDAVADYPDALRQHFFIPAKDEVLAYLVEGSPPEDTVSTLTQAGGLYDVIAKRRENIRLGDDDVARLRQGHVDYVARQVWAVYNTVIDLVGHGWHPEAARLALVDTLSDIPFANWERQLPMGAELLMASTPERNGPLSGAHDGRRAELRRFLESEVLPRSKSGWKRINALARRQNQKMEAIERETRGLVSTRRLQELRRELQAGNSDMEQLSEVLQLVMDECRGHAQVLQRRIPADSAGVRANSTRHRKLFNRLIRLETVSRTVEHYLKHSGIAEMQTRIDRLLLIRTAHTQKLFRDSVGMTLDPTYSPMTPPRIRPADVAGMRPKDRLENIIRLRYGMVHATSPAALAQATSLYATFVRHAAFPQVMLEHEFETLMAILKAHPDWMAHLRYAFLGLSGAMIPEDWQRVLQAAIPAPPAAADLRPSPTMGAKMRLLRDIAHYRDALRAIPRDTAPIARAIDALEDALRDNAPVPRVVVRYGLPTPELIDPTLSQGAPKEVMAQYFIVRDGHSAPPAKDPWLAVVEMDVPLDRFVRYLVEGDPIQIANGQYITTTSQTNAAFNRFLMATFTRRHVTVQEGMLTPELVALAKRQMLTLEVRDKTEVAPPDSAPASGAPRAGTSASAIRHSGSAFFNGAALMLGELAGSHHVGSHIEAAITAHPLILAAVAGAAAGVALYFSRFSEKARLDRGSAGAQVVRDATTVNHSGAPWTEEAGAQLLKGARQLWGRLRHRVVPYAPHDLWAELGGDAEAIYDHVYAAMDRGETLINPDTGAPFTLESLAGYINRRRFADGFPAPKLVLPRPPDTTSKVSHYSGAPFVDRFIGLMIQQAAAATVTDPDYRSPAPGQLNDDILAEAPIYAAVFAATFSNRSIERRLMALNKFDQLVRSGRLDDTEIRDGARALANALINGYAGEQSPIAPHSFLFYANRLLGLTERSFSRDRHVQARIWEEEAVAGFRRHLPQPPAPEGDPSGGGAPGARIEHHMQILPDVRPVVRGILQGALSLLSRTELGRKIADHPWLQSAARALGLQPDLQALAGPETRPDATHTDSPPEVAAHPVNEAAPVLDVSAENRRVLNDIPAGQMGAAQTITMVLARRPMAFITHHILTVEDNGVLTITADPAGKKARLSLQVLDVLNLFRDTEQQKHLKRLIHENRLTPSGVILKPEVPDWLRDFCLSRRSNDPLRTAYKYAKQAAVARAMRDGLSAGLAESARPTLQELFVSRVMAAVVVSKGKAFEKGAAPLLNDLHGIAVGRSPLRERGKPVPMPPHSSTPAPWAGGPLRQRLDMIAGAEAGAIFDTLPIADSADPDACKAAHIARMAILAPWVRQHVFHYDATIHLLYAMIAFAKDYRSRLGAVRTAQERDKLTTQWRRESPLFDEIAELMKQQARTPDEEDLAMEVSDRLLNGETGDLGTVSVLLRALEDMPSTVLLAADHTLGPRHKKHRLPSVSPSPPQDPSGLASELRSDFGIPTDTSWRAIQSLLEYTELASTGQLSIAELSLGAHDLAQVLANGYADDQSPIEPHSLLFYANRLLGLRERQLALSNHAQAKVWEDEALEGLTKRRGKQ